MHTALHPVCLLPFAETATRPIVAAGNAPDLSMLMGVAAVLVVLIGALAYAFRRVVLVQLKQRAAGKDMAVLEVLPLGGKRQLAVVRCFDRTFALGLGERDVSLVAELDRDAVERDRVLREETRRAAGPEAPRSRGRVDAAFTARLASAKAQLLGVRDVIPAARPDRPTAAPDPETPELGEVDTPRPGSDREFVA
ncbi:MAG: flagellar biosynthetic protein FliO [Planctomycetota bacterium]